MAKKLAIEDLYQNQERDCTRDDEGIVPPVLRERFGRRSLRFHGIAASLGYGLDDYTEGRIVGGANLARKILRVVSGEPVSVGPVSNRQSLVG